MDITGKWQGEQTDDLEACMKATGVPDAFAKCSGLKLQLEISRDGDTYTFRETVSLPLSEHTVVIGKGFTTRNWLGKTITGDVQKVGNNIVEKSKEGDVSSEITFQRDGSTLTKTRKYASSKCSLTYTKL